MVLLAGCHAAIISAMELDRCLVSRSSPSSTADTCRWLLSSLAEESAVNKPRMLYRSIQTPIPYHGPSSTDFIPIQEWIPITWFFFLCGVVVIVHKLIHFIFLGVRGIFQAFLGQLYQASALVVNSPS